MLRAISWSAYFRTISVGVLVYWAAVMLLFYRREIRGYWSKVAGQGRSAESREPGQTDVAGDAARPDEGPHKIMEELRLLFLSAKEQQFQKEEIFMALELHLKARQPWSGGEHADIIKRFIVSQLQLVCHIKVEEQAIEYMFRG